MATDKIIAIETSSRQGSVALAIGPKLIAEREFATQTEHGRELLPTLEDLCREHNWKPNEIGQCFLSIGPGSFTGLRVAVTFTRALALAHGVRICAVPTLEAIAQNCLGLPMPPQRLAVILDAKRHQVFAEIFELTDSTYKSNVPARLASPDEILSGDPMPSAVMGEGIDYHQKAVETSGVKIVDRVTWQPHAAMVHKIGWKMANAGQFTHARELVPFYIRRPEAEELWEKRQPATQLPPINK